MGRGDGWNPAEFEKISTIFVLLHLRSFHGRGICTNCIWPFEIYIVDCFFGVWSDSNKIVQLKEELLEPRC